MHIDSMIRTKKAPKSFFEKAKYKHLLRKDIRKMISELGSISIDELKNDLYRASSLNGMKPLSDKDSICIKYNLPIDGALEISEYLASSYYFNHLYEIYSIVNLYSSDYPLFNIEDKEKYGKIYLYHAALFQIFERASKEKQLGIISARIKHVENDIAKLKQYKELIGFTD